MGKASAFWDAAREDTVRAMYGRGATASEIARVLGADCTRNMVIGKIVRLGLAGRGRRPAKPKTPKTPRVAAERVARAPKPPKNEPIAPPSYTERAAAWAPLPGVPPIDFMGLRAGVCHWPIGREMPYQFCGAPAESAGKPYCAKHARLSVAKFGLGITGITGTTPPAASN